MRVAAHVYQSPMIGESRIERITGALLDAGIVDEVLLVGTRAEGLPWNTRDSRGREILRIGRTTPRGAGLLTKAITTLRWSAGVLRRVSGRRIDIVNCHAVSLLPLSYLLALQHRAILIYDPHELETETFYCRGLRRIMLKIVERLFVHRAAHTFVVGPRIAAWYRDAYGITPTIVRNMPVRRPISQETSQFRERLRIAPDRMVFLYLGKLAPGRGIEKCLSVFERIPTCEFVCMGDGELVPMIQTVARRTSNIHHHPAVPPSEVLREARGADVGIFISDPSCLSYEYSCPNKFFEYVQSGLPIIVTENFVEQADMVRAHGLGWVLPQDAHACVEMISGLTQADVARARTCVAQAADLFHWDVDREKLVTTYRKLLKMPTSAARPDS